MLTCSLVKLPFPLTLGFKQMLQRGIDTPDMDVRWVSSLSWYILNWFGLNGLFRLLLGNDNGITPVLSPILDLIDISIYLFLFFPQPQVNHNLISHPVCSSNPSLASRRTTTSYLRPRKRTSSSRRGFISGPWRISRCACCKGMVNYPNRLLRKFDLNCPKEGGRDCRAVLLYCRAFV